MLHVDTRTFFKFICNCCMSKDDEEMKKVYEFAQAYLTAKLDLTYYLKMIDHINRLKYLILKPHQIFMQDHQNKINLMAAQDKLLLNMVDHEGLSSENEIQLTLVQILIQKLKDKGFESIDYVLYEHFDSDLKKFIDNHTPARENSPIKENNRTSPTKNMFK